LFSVAANAQYDGKERDVNSRFNPGTGWYFTGIRPAQKNRARKYDRLMFDITHNDWVGDFDPNLKAPQSTGFGINLMFDKPLVDGNTFSLGYGLSYHTVNIKYDGILLMSSNSTNLELTQNKTNYGEKLKYRQVSIPLEVRFRKESWKHLKLHLGGKIGYAYRAHVETAAGTSSVSTVIRNFQFLDFNELQYSVHTRIGLRNWALFAEYNISDLFADPSSTSLNVVRAGISISLF